MMSSVESSAVKGRQHKSSGAERRTDEEGGVDVSERRGL